MNLAIRAWVMLSAGLAACSVPQPDVPHSDACEAACAHRAELGCLEPALASQCVPVCLRAAARGLYDPSCAARASRDGMRACGVRCGVSP